jgi:hypothetical protein
MASSAEIEDQIPDARATSGHAAAPPSSVMNSRLSLLKT